MAALARGGLAPGWLVVVLALASPGAVTGACSGDCDGDGAVEVAELVRAVRIALGDLPLAECPAADGSGDDRVGVTDLIRAVRHALDGCPAGDCTAGGGDACGPDELCELPAGMCGAADLEGTCVPRPAACPLLVDPVCGCDGVTYSNDCFRRVAGVPLDHAGACP